MPKSKQPTVGLVDTWGRKNRTLTDRKCPSCGNAFRPLRSSSRYCSRRCSWSNNGGHNKKPISLWKNQKGYIEGRIWAGDTQLRFKLHRFVAEGILGRPLQPWEDVHHINGKKDDNRPENLEVISHAEHSKKTSAARDYAAGYALKLTEEEREARSLRAIAMNLSAMGRAAKLKKLTP